MGKRIGFLISFIVLSLGLKAQDMSVEMADTFREEGKIYVVVAVVAVAFLGLFIYLITQDLRLRKLEKSMEK